jgi:hypothetical protein
MDINHKEEFIICPCCGEEAFVTVNPGFNKIDCPACEYYLIVYLDETGKSWTREHGVLAVDD